ncbi:phage tail assembly chaperone family protein, TAC [Acinetobacter bohemicus]|uniref:phage tail assembly chaperone family protein, TAC n=1 Tax=Acinetobacter bohemicus TaxID=1435036 RepID=UPI00192AAC20|nr:phage tail assembly chaperone family protein, TAC [Acinetobacter bohemicus]CAD9197493.1 hypothetical protein QAC21B_03667 [Acinetobacter bohemicus]
MKKLNTSALLALSGAALSDLVPKAPKFIINDEQMEADVLVKSLSYDQVTHMFEGCDVEKITVADVVKKRVLLTVFNAETKEPLFPDLEAVGQTHPAIINALHDASDEVNDFLGKNKLKLKNMNSGASSSSTESVEKPSSKPKRK